MINVEEIHKDDYVVFDNGVTVKVANVDLRYAYDLRIDFYKREDLGYKKSTHIWLERPVLANERVKLVKVLHGDSKQR